MKSISSPRSYFTAYPLKALTNEPSAKHSTNQSPYLKAVLSGRTRTVSRVRVFPMINPYKASSVPVIIDNSNLPKDIELIEKEWFNNYE